MTNRSRAMNPADYQRLAARTECDQLKSRERMAGVSPDHYGVDTTPIRLNHSIVGLAGEVGELASLLQKWVYYGKPIDADMRLKLAAEFGDCLWYIAEGLNALGLDMSLVMEANIGKLKARYPEKYSDELAAEEGRNRQQEDKVVSTTLQRDDSLKDALLRHKVEWIEKMTKTGPPPPNTPLSADDAMRSELLKKLYLEAKDRKQPNADCPPPDKQGKTEEELPPPTWHDDGGK